MSQAVQRLKSIIKSKLCFFICSTAYSFVVLYISPWFYAYTNKFHILFLLLHLSFSCFFTSLQSSSLKFSLGLSIISPLFGDTVICFEDELVLCHPFMQQVAPLRQFLSQHQAEAGMAPQDTMKVELGAAPADRSNGTR